MTTGLTSRNETTRLPQAHTQRHMRALIALALVSATAAQVPPEPTIEVLVLAPSLPQKGNQSIMIGGCVTLSATAHRCRTPDGVLP